MVLRLDLPANPGKQAPIVEAVDWDEAAPRMHEEKILSIMCGNTRLHWALHNGRSSHFSPILFWRTSPVTDDEFDSTNPSAVLGTNVPTQAQQEVFGLLDDHTKASATYASHKRKVPALTIYVMTTNPHAERGLQFLFSDVPHRMYRMENTDFFSSDQGCYPTFGIDRAACLFAAHKTYPKKPCMVLDGGTAFTYTGLDSNGTVLGGGIAPGLAARFRALSDYCGNLPVIEFDTLAECMEVAKTNMAPLPIFAKDTQTAMISAVLQEWNGQCRNVVKHFIQASKIPTPGKDGESVMSKRKVTILITGGDMGYIKHALTDEPRVVPAEPGTSLNYNDFEIFSNKHLEHYGIGRILLDQLKSQTTLLTPDFELRNRLIGQRIAKEFQVRNIDGETKYRGSILSFKAGNTLEEDLYLVRYDDGDQEHLEIFEIHDALKLYVQVGERSNINNQIWDEKRREDKKKGADEMAHNLLEKAPSLKQLAKKRAADAEASAASAKRAADTAKLAKIDMLETKKAKTSDQSHAEREKLYKGRRVAKNFPMENSNGELEDQIFYGYVHGMTPTGYWHIQYDDDDEEDFDEADLKIAIRIYDENKKGDPLKESDKNDEMEAEELAFGPGKIMPAAAALAAIGGPIKTSDDPVDA